MFFFPHILFIYIKKLKKKEESYIWLKDFFFLDREKVCHFFIVNSLYEIWFLFPLSSKKRKEKNSLKLCTCEISSCEYGLKQTKNLLKHMTMTSFFKAECLKKKSQFSHHHSDTLLTNTGGFTFSVLPQTVTHVNTLHTISLSKRALFLFNYHSGLSFAY